MNIGKMDRRITLESFATTRDNFGQPIEAWTGYASIWGGKKDKVSSEGVSSGVVVEILRTEWIVRYRSETTTKDRVNFGGVFFYIVGIVELGRREGMILITERRA